MATKKQTVQKRSVSFPRDLVAKAEAMADSQRRSFSNYLQKLVAEDLVRASETPKTEEEVGA